jgi:hypothetical protein
MYFRVRDYLQRPSLVAMQCSFMSDLVFQRGQGFSGELWDDSELIAAWNRQQAGTTSAEARNKLDAVRDMPESEASTSDVAVNSQGQAPRPPFPSWADEPTRRLLEAWFQAGYWSGVKQTKQ